MVQFTLPKNPQITAAKTWGATNALLPQSSRCDPRRLPNKKFALMALGRSKGGDMRDPPDTYRNQLVPMVVEQTMRGERAYDIYSRLFTS